MKTKSSAYKDHMEKKYLPGREKYLQWLFYPKIIARIEGDKIGDLGSGTGEFLKFPRTKK